LFAFFSTRGGTVRQAGLDNYNFVHFIACRIHDERVLAGWMPKSRIIVHNSQSQINCLKIGRFDLFYSANFKFLRAESPAGVRKWDSV
jgi:hypothetical protein